MMEELPELPKGWMWTLTNEVGSTQLGRQRSPKDHHGPHMRPYLRVANVYEDRIDTSDVKEMNFTPEEFEVYQLKPGDILLNEGQSPSAVGRPAIFKGEVEGACFQNTLIRFQCLSCLEPSYALTIFRAQMHLGWYSRIAKITTNIAHLGLGRFRKVPFPLAPLPEQRRIVAAIETHFTRLDAAVAALERVKTRLVRARASVLKVAVEGRLVPTEAELARTEGRDYETGEVLLERILVERRAWHEQGQQGAKRRKGYKEPEAPETEGLGELPEGWVWASVEQVLENHDSDRVPVSRKERSARPGNYPYFGASGVIDTIDGYTHDGRYLLVGEDGANLLSRSKPIAFIASGQIWVNNHAHVLKPLGGMAEEFIQLQFNHMDLTPYVSGSAQPKLPQRSMNMITVEIPPLAEQHRIVAEVDRRLSVIDALESTVDTNLARCTRLRQAILKRAFEGRLVPQDPRDEPAAEMLARVKAGGPAEMPMSSTSRKTPSQLSLLEG